MSNTIFIITRLHLNKHFTDTSISFSLLASHHLWYLFTLFTQFRCITLKFLRSLMDNFFLYKCVNKTLNMSKKKKKPQTIFQIILHFFFACIGVMFCCSSSSLTFYGLYIQKNINKFECSMFCLYYNVFTMFRAQPQCFEQNFSHETHSNLFSLLRSSVPTSSRLSRDKYLFFVLFHANVVKFSLHVDTNLQKKKTKLMCLTVLNRIC